MFDWKIIRGEGSCVERLDKGKIVDPFFDGEKGVGIEIVSIDLLVVFFGDYLEGEFKVVNVCTYFI